MQRLKNVMFLMTLILSFALMMKILLYYTSLQSIYLKYI